MTSSLSSPRPSAPNQLGRPWRSAMALPGLRSGGCCDPQKWCGSLAPAFVSGYARLAAIITPKFGPEATGQHPGVKSGGNTST
jgi:hypothetical protein